MEENIFKKTAKRHRSLWLSVFAVAVLALLPIASRANVFDGDQEASVRESLNLYGCYAEDLSVGSSTAEATHDLLYVGCNSANGIFVSNDFGTTWTGPVDGSDFGTISDVAASDEANTAYMIGGIKLYKTADGGASWTQLGAEENLMNFGQQMEYGNGRLVSVYREDDQVGVYDEAAGSLSLVSVTGDANNSVAYVAYAGGDTWYALAGANDNNTFYYSNDGGDTWVSSGAVGNLNRIAVNPSNPDYFVVSGEDGLNYTDDGGQTFQTLNYVGSATTSTPTVTDTGWVYMSLSFTSDNGANWYSVANTTDGVHLKGDWWIIDSYNNHYYTKTGTGVAYTTDLSTWHTSNEGLQALTIYDLSIDDTKDVLWLATLGGFVKSENFNTALSSGGQPTWSDFIKPDEDENGNSNIDGTDAVWVDPANSDVVLVSALGRMWRSVDAGTTWTEVEYDGSNVTDFVQDFDGNLYLTYRNNSEGGVYQSTDNGVTWTDLAMPVAPANAITVDGDNHLIVGVGIEQDNAGAHRGLYFYDGSSWSQITEDSSHPLYGRLVNDVLCVSETGYTYAAVADAAPDNGTNGSLYGGLFLSNDSVTWDSWSQVSDGLMNDMWAQSLASEDDGQFIYVSSARPAGTGYVFKCDFTGENCGTYYEGLIDEYYNALLFDDFVSVGTGMYRYESKATLTLQKLKKKQHNKYRLRATLTDNATSASLNSRTVKLMYKLKASGKYKMLKKQKVKNGKTVFLVRKRGFYQLRWKPVSDVDTSAYSSVVEKSGILRIKKNSYKLQLTSLGL